MRFNKSDCYKLVGVLLFLYFLIIFSIIIIQVSTEQGATFSDYKRRTYAIKLIISLLIIIIFLLSIFVVLSLKEYKGYITRRSHIRKGNSYLNISDIFNNENRLNILREILNNPGIHQNELLRNCNLQKGQLQWHLEVLLKNGIIKKTKYGQYTIYFPITSSIEFIEKYKNMPNKSETTENVLDIIQKNPGINSSKISHILNLSRNTIKYHVDKLYENELIYLKEKGRKIEIYPTKLLG